LALVCGRSVDPNVRTYVLLRTRHASDRFGGARGIDLDLLGSRHLADGERACFEERALGMS
jgi:hypothetical protein